MTNYITARALSDIPAELMARLRLKDPTLICVGPGEYSPLVFLAEVLTPFDYDADTEPWVITHGKRLPVHDLGVAITMQCRNLDEGNFFSRMVWAQPEDVRCKNPSWKAYTRQLMKR